MQTEKTVSGLGMIKSKEKHRESDQKHIPDGEALCRDQTAVHADTAAEGLNKAYDAPKVQYDHYIAQHHQSGQRNKGKSMQKTVQPRFQRTDQIIGRHQIVADLGDLHRKGQHGQSTCKNQNRKKNKITILPAIYQQEDRKQKQKQNGQRHSDLPSEIPEKRV